MITVLYDYEPLNYFPERKLTDIRLRNINWTSFLQSQKISQDDYQLLSALDKSREATFQENEIKVTKTLFTVIPQLHDDIATQYILLLINDTMAPGYPHTVNVFHEACKNAGVCAWGPFLEILQRDDILTVSLAAHTLAKLASWGDELMPDSDLVYFFQSLNQLIGQQQPQQKIYLQVHVHCLQILLRVEHYRYVYITIDGINKICKAIPQSSNQVQYQLIFCLWVLTFSDFIIERLFSHNIIPVLAPLLVSSNKEKLHRIILAFYRNMIEKNNDPDLEGEILLQMIQCELLDILKNLSGHYIHDVELEENIPYLMLQLKKALGQMCTFDKYAIEVRSGRLDWSPVHKSERFWVENSHRLNEKNYELLRCLILLLETSNEALVLTIALYDIGQYMRRYPEGKQALENLGGKVPILQLLTHHDEKVRSQALLTSAILLRFQ